MPPLAPLPDGCVPLSGRVSLTEHNRVRGYHAGTSNLVPNATLDQSAQEHAIQLAIADKLFKLNRTDIGQNFYVRYCPHAPDMAACDGKFCFIERLK